jgi:hypothetical protein
VTTTFLFAASKIGALPLAVAFQKGQSEENYAVAFNLIKEELGNYAFGGKVSPISFRIDDSRAEYNAVKRIWPDSKIYLCTFHVLQSVWRWLWESKNKISKEDRQELMFLFRQMLYAPNEIEFDEFCEMFFTSDIAMKYANFIDYARAQWLQRKEIWALCFRTETITRGHHTNNFVESAVRIFKEVILVRCKAFNTVALVNFVTNTLENYHCSRLLRFSAFGSAKLDMEYKKLYHQAKPKTIQEIDGKPLCLLVSSTSNEKIFYSVNLLTETCDCLRGQRGHFCKHLFVAADYKKVALFTSPEFSTEDRAMFAGLAMGKENTDKEFYKPMRRSEKENQPRQRPSDLISHAQSSPDKNEEISPFSPSSTAQPNENEDDTERVMKSEIAKYLENQQKLVALLSSDPNKYSLKLLQKANANLSKIETVQGAVEFLKTNSTVNFQRGKIIPVNSTSICRRVPHKDGTKYGGKRRISSGARTQNENDDFAPKTKKKRTRCLAENIWNNVPNGKSHGSGH